MKSGFKDHQSEENIYDTLTAVNQEILARFEKRNGGKVEERPMGIPIAQSSEGNSVKQSETDLIHSKV